MNIEGGGEPVRTLNDVEAHCGMRAVGSPPPTQAFLCSPRTIGTFIVSLNWGSEWLLQDEGMDRRF